ncbi:HNH endonuclease, partial [Nitrospira sp. BLG_2]|uniref:HNH endonuclease n=1 Tax=Nitrospira sp. BLG_2 TaxID=3397507 RepID=UPI003B9A3A78
CKTHEFDNLIALCPNCHTRYDSKQIDRGSMRIYKANLALVNGRYSDFERRILDVFVQAPHTASLTLPVGYEPLLHYLIRDGLLAEPVLDSRQGVVLGGSTPIAGFHVYQLTPAGQEFVHGYMQARSLATEDA